MRLTTPRVVPAAAESWTEEQREIVAPMLARGPILNIFRTLLTHPSAAKAWTDCCMRSRIIPTGRYFMVAAA